MDLEYQDSAQQLTQAAQRVEGEAGTPEEWTEAQLPPLPDVTSDAVRAALVRLQQLLHVDGSLAGQGLGAGASSAAAAGAAAEASPEALHRAHAMLETCVLPALAELAKQQQQRQQQAGGAPATSAAAATAALAAAGGGSASAAASQHAAVSAMLAQYPLGFSTGDAGADLAATILRMLYIKDLRALQVGGQSGPDGWACSGLGWLRQAIASGAVALCPAALQIPVGAQQGAPLPASPGSFGHAAPVFSQ